MSAASESNEGIIISGGVRSYYDGTIAKSCNDYLTTNLGTYKYVGAVGDGVYKIQPIANASSFNVNCYMSTPEGLGVNHLRNGSLIGITQMSPWVWMNWSPAAVYDNDDSTVFGLTGDDIVGNNLYRGVEMQFNTNKTLKAMKLNTYFVPGAYFTIEYHNGSVWTFVSEHLQTSNQNGVIYFNQNGLFSSSRWRWYISSFPTSSGSNFYGREIRVYE